MVVPDVDTLFACAPGFTLKGYWQVIKPGMENGNETAHA